MIKIEGEEVVEDSDKEKSESFEKGFIPPSESDVDPKIYYSGEYHCMEFECTSRERTEDGMLYHVTPLSEIGDLDYEGHTVKINGRDRLCDKFEVDEEGKLTILVK